MEEAMIARTYSPLFSEQSSIPKLMPAVGQRPSSKMFQFFSMRRITASVLETDLLPGDAA